MHLEDESIEKEKPSRHPVTGKNQIAPMTVLEGYQAINRLRAETEARKFVDTSLMPMTGSTDSNGVCPKTFDKVRIAAGTKARVPQSLTSSRLENILGVRLIYITACFIYAIGSFLLAAYKWNADCTTFIIKAAGTGQKVIVVRETGDKSQVTSTVVNGDLNLLMKWFALGNAAGTIGAPFIIVALDDMEPDDFYLAKVPGLHTSDDVNATDGFLAICKTKGGTSELWKRYFLDYCIPQIVAVTSKINAKNADGTDIDMRPFLTTDGEACILNSAFDAAAVMAGFRGSMLDYLKLGPGVTPWQQPPMGCVNGVPRHQSRD